MVSRKNQKRRKTRKQRQSRRRQRGGEFGQTLNAMCKKEFDKLKNFELDTPAKYSLFLSLLNNSKHCQQLYTLEDAEEIAKNKLTFPPGTSNQYILKDEDGQLTKEGKIQLEILLNVIKKTK
jgi:hypothetical protein